MKAKKVILLTTKKPHLQKQKTKTTTQHTATETIKTKHNNTNTTRRIHNKAKRDQPPNLKK